MQSEQRNLTLRAEDIQGVRILVVDDNAMNQLVVELISQTEDPVPCQVRALVPPRVTRIWVPVSVTVMLR